MAVPRIVPYLESTDFAGVRDFYVGVLGLRVAMEDPDMPDYIGLASPDNASAQIVVAAQGVEQPMPRLGVDVGDAAAVDAAHDRACPHPPRTQPSAAGPPAARTSVPKALERICGLQAQYTVRAVDVRRALVAGRAPRA